MKVSFVEKFFNVKFKGLDFDVFSEVSTDSRTVAKKALFVALKGENFDGNKFVEQAYSKGASAALISDESVESENTILVKDTLRSFQDLAKAWQKHVNPKVIGITGSNGKTTTKFFTAQLLEPFFKVCYSPKSFNNSFGVPITQSLLKEEDEVLVSELGTGATGELSKLVDLVEPDVCMVTTVGPSHLEGFGTVENVAVEKQKIYESGKVKTRIFNLDNSYTRKMFDSYKGEKITVSTEDESADIFFKAEQVSIGRLLLKGKAFGHSYEGELALFGKHNVYNVMMALAVGKSLGVGVQSLLDKLPILQTPWGRSQILEGSKDVVVLFDGYNSNLQSMRALLSSVKEIEKTRGVHLVLGEMLELGSEALQMHRDLGVEAGGVGAETVVFIGASFRAFLEGLELSKFNKKSIISDTYNQSLAIELESVVHPGDTVVLKASRGMKIERFFSSLGL